MKYYTQGCPDWKWRYNYHYPPLLQDLIKYIPYFETTFIKPNTNVALSPLVQLCYVLPNQSHHLLPDNIQKLFKKEFGDYYQTMYDFNWAFCRYFWESHVDLPDVDIDELTELISTTA
jgi:5'-3' exoribonuclease 2